MHKKGWHKVIFLACLNELMSGCAVLMIGTAGVAGGYAVSNDGIEGIKDLKYEKVWKAGEAVLSQQGRVEKRDEKHGTLIARIQDSTVRFELIQATPKSIIVRVRARRWRNMFPDMKLARRVYSMVGNESG